MRHNQIYILPVLCSTFLLNICCQNWYSAGPRVYENISNIATHYKSSPNKYLTNEVAGSKVYFDQKLDNLKFYENSSYNKDKLLDIQEENSTLNALPNLETYHITHVKNNQSIHPNNILSPNKTKFTHISLNNTIENINVFRKRPNIYRRCPPLRPNKRKPLSSRQRNKKFLEVFQIVEFQNEICTSSSGLEGKCLHEYECKSAGGAPMGDCADGYGTCCVSKYLINISTLLLPF